MYRGMQRMRSIKTSGASIFSYLSLPQFKRKASKSWSAVQDTYFSTKDIFERHRVVFTVSTSIASVATAWIGYSLRHYHDSRVDKRLEAIESAMKRNYEIEDPEFKKLVSHNISFPASLATAGTTFVLGYIFGWRGGRWYETRRFRKEQMKLLNQITPRGWSPNISLLLRKLEFRRHLSRILRRPLVSIRLPGYSKKANGSKKNATVLESTKHNTSLHQN